MEEPKFYEPLQKYIGTLPDEFAQIGEERQEELKELAASITSKKEAGEAIELVVICTHNSRRSHMGQLWLQVAAAHYGTKNVITYSGGTEATAFNPRAVAAMQRAGFEISAKNEESNTLYEASFAENGPKLELFSKKYRDEPNPKKNFIALLVCSSADEACPIVIGASNRHAIPYNDPKNFDGMDLETQKYDERCRQLAREMFFVMAQVKESK